MPPGFLDTLEAGTCAGSGAIFSIQGSPTQEVLFFFAKLVFQMDKEDPTQGIPGWLQPFIDNLEDLETHVPAHSSEREYSDWAGATKVGYKNGSTVFILTSLKTEIATFA